MIPLLQPIFQGPLAAHAEALRLSPTPPADALPAAELFSAPGPLTDALQRHARQVGYRGSDWRPLASSWSLVYLAKLLPPVCAAATLLRHALPVGAAHTWITLDEQGLPDAFHIRSLGHAMPDADVWQRYEPLVWAHLMPLADALHALTRLPRKILWGNAMRNVAGIFDAARALPATPPGVDSDRAALLHGPRWAPGGAAPHGGAINPLFGVDRVATVHHGDHTDTLTLHRQCCLMYKLIDGHGYCDGCPLDPQFRRSKTARPTSAGAG